MALKSIDAASVGTSEVQLAFQGTSYTVTTDPDVVLGWTVTNIDATDVITVNAFIRRNDAGGARDLYVVKNVSIVVGGAKDINPGKLGLNVGDKLFVISSKAASLCSTATVTADN
jgi:hypothetical protein